MPDRRTGRGAKGRAVTTLLGASGTAVGVATGFGDFVGYPLRRVSGRAADRTHLYWPITTAGYLIQMAAVPALALAALFAPLMFLGGFWAALAGAAVWGLGTGVHESISRPPLRRWLGLTSVRRPMDCSRRPMVCSDSSGAPPSAPCTTHPSTRRSPSA